MSTVEGYIAGFPPKVRAILMRVRKAARAGAPRASEVISYRMPALRGTRILVWYAAFKNHIGLYPPIRGDARLEKAAARYAGPRGNLKFSYDEPVPYALITRLVRLRARQDAGRS